VSVAVPAVCCRRRRCLLWGDLYAFCRAVDDMADENIDQDAARAGLLDLRQAVLAKDASHPLAAQLFALQASRRLPSR